MIEEYLVKYKNPNEIGVVILVFATLEEAQREYNWIKKAVIAVGGQLSLRRLVKVGGEADTEEVLDCYINGKLPTGAHCSPRCLEFN